MKTLWVWFPSGTSFCWILWSTFIPLTLPLLQSMPLGINWWRCVALIVLRRGHKIFSHWWEVSIIGTCSKVSHLPLFTVFFVQRVRCRSQSIRTRCCTFWSSCSGHHWHQRRRVTSEPNQSANTLKTIVQAEEGVGAKEVGRVFCHWCYRCSWQI